MRDIPAGQGVTRGVEGLVAAIGPDLTGRVHLAYRRRADRRWWRRVYPGRSVPRWDHVSLCGRRGLVAVDTWQTVDCRSCRRIAAARSARLASRVGA